MNKYIILLLFLFSCQETSKKKEDFKFMNYKEFKQIALDSERLMCDSLTTMSTKNAIYIVKIINTIQLYVLDTLDDEFKNVHSQFVKCSFANVLKALDMQLSIGMSYYSPKFKIVLGVRKSDTSSYFKLDSLSLLNAK